LTLTSSMTTRRCAFSVKSNQQFRGDAAPSDFVRLIWKQLRHQQTDRFDPRLDLLGLVTSPLPSKTDRDLHELLEWARKQDARTLSTRLSKAGVASTSKRCLFASFTCPEDLALRY